jgi:3-methylcrotonyl-CoA carboxylase alpha subunit
MEGVTRIADGVYRVERNGRSEIVYVAGNPAHRWAFWNGRVFERGARPLFTGALTAPMPATVVKVLVAPGAVVRKGDTLIIVEAMKMELPIRAPGDAVVKTVHCQEGELVQPEQPLLDLT